MGIWWQLAIGAVGLWLVLRFVLSRLESREPSDSVDEPLVEDGGRRGRPPAGVPSPKKRGPHNRSGAVALAEPDYEDENRSFPPRSL
jgi:hypothetical protein